MVDAWINCKQCGHRFDTSLPHCPRCDVGNTFSKSGSNGGTSNLKKIAIGAGIGFGGFFVIILVIGSMYSSDNLSSSGLDIGSAILDEDTIDNENASATVQSSSITQKVLAIEDFFIFTLSDDDYYKAQLILIDDKVRAISADGIVSVTISDEKGNRLYEKTFQVKESDFGTYQTMFGASTTALVWTIPKSDVKPGIGEGSASVVFTTLDGNTLSKSAGSPVFITNE